MDISDKASSATLRLLRSRVIWIKDARSHCAT